MKTTFLFLVCKIRAKKFFNTVIHKTSMMDNESWIEREKVK